MSLELSRESGNYRVDGSSQARAVITARSVSS